MRTHPGLVAILALGLFGSAAEGVTPAKKKSVGKKSAHSVATARKKTGSTAARTTKTASTAKSGTSVRKKTAATTRSAAARRGKKAPVRRTTWRNRQLTPTPERYKQIQEALSSKGYLPAGSANGQWTDASASALKKFQADQNLDASGKINSLSLIALGLGPKHDTATAKPPAVPAIPPPASLP